MGENGWRGRMGREEGKAKGEIPILTQATSWKMIIKIKNYSINILKWLYIWQSYNHDIPSALKLLFQSITNF